MKIKRIAVFALITFSLGLASFFSIASAKESSQMVEGHYERISKLMFENHLMVDSAGLCVLGTHTYGAPTLTDLLVVGTDRNAGMYAIQGYWPNMTNHLPVDYHSDNSGTYAPDIVRDMVKFLNPNNGNMEIIYAEGDWLDDDGSIVKQDFVNPTKSDGALVPEWVVPTSEQCIALALGNFDSNVADLEVAGLCLDGDVYVVTNIETGGSPSYWKHDIDGWTWTNFFSSQVKTPIDAIDDLDGNNPTQQDIVYGWYTNVTAISTNSSNREIWTVDIGYFLTDVVAVADQNSDGLQEVVATTKDGVFLLNGADGSTLNSISETGAYFRDVDVYNSTAIITGNKDGDLFVWDINTASPTFGDIILTRNWYGRNIYDILDVGDLDSDGVDEFAVGGYTLAGVAYGNNLSSIWARSPYGSSWNGQPINVYDMALLDDLDGDGHGDLAVTGYATNIADNAVFVFGTYGQLHFVPDLVGGGYIDSSCEGADHTFVFTATASQAKNLAITAEIIIDGTHILLDPDSNDWDGGVSYSYSSSYNDGDHTYQFVFTDGIDTVTTIEQTFQVGGDCGGGNGGLDIPGARIWMILPSMIIGVVIAILFAKKQLKH
jgi:hypothetical protein